MITVVATLQAAPGKEDELRQVLTQMVQNVKANEGAKVPLYELHTSDSEQGQFMFYERYADEEAFGAHGKTDHMRQMGLALRDQQLLGGAPVINRYTHIAGVA